MKKSVLSGNFDYFLRNERRKKYFLEKEKEKKERDDNTRTDKGKREQHDKNGK